MVAAAGEESLRRTGLRERDGARSTQLGRSDRWPSFITRTLSSRVPFWSASRRAPDLEASSMAAGTTGGAAARTRREKMGDASDGSVTPAKGSVREEK
jgi:E3 ubiquitin-protein ligase ATL6/9/15/31/42/55